MARAVSTVFHINCYCLESQGCHFIPLFVVISIPLSCSPTSCCCSFYKNKQPNKSFWWWQCSHGPVYIGPWCSDWYIISSPPPFYTPLPLLPSLISFTVAVDVKHHVYLLRQSFAAALGCPLQGAGRAWSRVIWKTSCCPCSGSPSPRHWGPPLSSRHRAPPPPHPISATSLM